MVKRNELISYALDFVSYLISKTEKINRVILHGSVARGEFDEESDIDLFIDSDEKIERKINEIMEDYQETKRFKEWGLKGVKKEISIIAGKLDSEEWKDLKRSIMNTGIILYGKFKAEAEKVNHYTLFSFEGIKPDKKRILIYRKLFGFKTGKRPYPGISQKMNVIKVGKGSILVPIEHANEIKRYFHEKKVAVKMYDLWSDTKIN